VPISIVIGRNRHLQCCWLWLLFFRFVFEKLKNCPHIYQTNETMFPSGTGYKSTDPRDFPQGKRWSGSLSLMRHCLKSVQSWCGFDGWQLSLPTRKFSQ